MTRRLLLLVGAIAVAACPAPRPAPPPVVLKLERPPVPTVPDALEPPQPTLRLPKHFVPAEYRVHLALDPSKPGFAGRVEIAGKLNDRAKVIWLHGYKLAVTLAIAKGDRGEVPLVVTPKGEDLLELRASTALDPGAWTLELSFRGAYETVSTTGVFRQTIGKDAYVYSQFEATFARRAFPCIDEPDTKVPWQLTLDVPAALVAVSNTPPVKETVEGPLKRVEFAKTRPMPSYLVAFGVGPFEVIDAGKSKNGTPIRILALAKRAAEAAWAVKTSAPLLDALEEWFGTPYPYEKLDMLTIPITVGFGAMENAGLITYTETLILHDPIKASKERMYRWVVVAAHEIAHQWFGNLVTMQYWDDIWLNEGFANWVQRKVTHAIDHAYRDDLSELDVRNSALAADALVSARQIRQPIENAGDISNAFDGITYNKGASVLNMFERYVGTAVFQQGVRDYLKARAWGNASSKDFVAAIATAANKPEIATAFSSFLDRPGAPEITAQIQCTGQGAALKASVAVTQKRYVPPGASAPPASPWIVPICVAYDKGGTRADACTLVSTETASFEVPAKACPRWVMPNVEGRGYYRTAYTTAQITALRDEAWSRLSWTERRAIYFDVETLTTTGRLPLQVGLSFIPKLLAGNDRFTIPPALGLSSNVESLVPDNLREKYEYFLRTKFGLGATTMGLLPKDADTLDNEISRASLIHTVAWLGREPALVGEAIRLADRWRDLPHSIRGLVLRIAVDARPDLFEQIRRELAGEPDRKRRADMIGALARVRDPNRRQRALELVLDPKIDIRETQGMLFDGTGEVNRAAGRAFFKKHQKAIVARLPPDGTSSNLSGFAHLFTATCKAAERDAVVDYVTKTFASLTGGARVVKQAIESMDQCIARRALLEAEVKGWLQGIRIAKPKK